MTASTSSTTRVFCARPCEAGRKAAKASRVAAIGRRTSAAYAAAGRSVKVKKERPWARGFADAQRARPCRQQPAGPAALAIGLFDAYDLHVEVEVLSGERMVEVENDLVVA